MVVKTNSFVPFLDEFMARQFAFKINRPLVIVFSSCFQLFYLQKLLGERNTLALEIPSQNMTFIIHFSGNVPNPNASAAPSIENQGATTEHPCRNHNITTCFHLIALQMNKVKNL